MINLSMVGKKSIKESEDCTLYKQINKKKCGYELPFINEKSLDAFLFYNVYSEESLINEATYEISEDVNFIYQKKVKPVVDEFLKNSKKYIEELEDYLVIHGFDSDELESDISKQAHEKKPCSFLIGFHIRDCFYDPTGNFVFYSLLPYKVVSKLKEGGLEFNDLSKGISSRMKILLAEPNLKSTITHELTHWIDESIQNDKLTRHLKGIPSEWSKEKIELEVLTNDIEIQAYIHGLKEFKARFSQEVWDRFTFHDVFDAVEALRIKLNILKKSKKDLNVWKKKFFSRMSREGLIGKNMNSEELTDILGVKDDA